MIINAYGNNIQIIPESKNKIIGDTSKYFLYGKVVGVGELVKNIKVGDIIAYTLWGVNKLEKDGEEYFFIQDNSDFILAILQMEIKREKITIFKRIKDLWKLYEA